MARADHEASLRPLSQPLITAGIANSRAEVLRWAVGRIRENPAYAQLQERVHEINKLKAQF